MVNKIISIIIAIQITLTLVSTKEAPTIALYYESLCPGCEGFIGTGIKQFRNTKGHEVLATVKFYPYGNARQKKSGNKWVFTCQHGAPECQGNLIETCALNKMNSDKFMDFLICLRKNISSQRNDFIKTAKICEKDATVYQSIIDCYNSDEGNKLQHEIADDTDNLKPSHKWVPWITVDGVYNSKVQDKIQDNMVGWICDNYSDIPAIKKVCDSRVEEVKKEKNITAGFCAKEAKFFENLRIIY